MSGADKKSSPFASLASLRDALPKGPDEAVGGACAPEAPVTRAHDPFAKKVVVARSRKGRRGKGVTTIAGVDGDEELLASLAREIAKSLGCGVTVEEGVIVVQGEQESRVGAFLEARGARRVIKGT